MNQIHAFGLLHLAKNEVSAVNLRVTDFSEQIRVYLGNASLLSKSLAKQGIKFTLLTNDRDRLIEVLPRQSQELEIKEIEFKTVIPSGIKFFSAHSKIDVFRHIAELELAYSMYCDIDMVCLKPLPDVVKNLIADNIPMVYDVSDQVIPGDGHEFLIKNLEKVHGIRSEGRWIGGEFLAGTPEFFKKITNEIDAFLPNYFEKLITGQIPSGNDEYYTSAAIEIMRRKGTYISDVGLFEIVGRYWSSGTGFVQKDFKYFENVFLLHLPADKFFLSKMNYKLMEFSRELFIKKYKEYRRNYKIKRSPVSVLYFLFFIKSKIIGLRSIKIPNKSGNYIHGSK